MGKEGCAACGPQGGRASAHTQVPGDRSPSLLGPLDFGAVAFGGAPQSLSRSICLQSRRGMLVFRLLDVGRRVVGERMTSTASTPGPSLSEPRCFSGVSPSAGRHSFLLISRLLGLLAPEGGLKGSVTESWGVPRTREAEVLQKILSR